MIRWNDSIAATTLSWASITPLGRPVVPEVKTSSNTSVGCGAAPARQLRLPVRRKGRIGLGGDRVDRRRREALEPSLARVGRVAARAQDQVAGAGRLDDALDRVGRHAQVQRYEDQPGSHRPEVGGRQLGRGGRPGQQAVARGQPEGPQPPRDDARPAIQLAIAPRRRSSRHRAGGSGRSGRRTPRRLRRAGRAGWTPWPKGSVPVARFDGHRRVRPGYVLDRILVRWMRFAWDIRSARCASAGAGVRSTSVRVPACLRPKSRGSSAVTSAASRWTDCAVSPMPSKQTSTFACAGTVKGSIVSSIRHMPVS